MLNLPENARDFFLSDIPMLEMKKSFAVFGADSSLSKNIAKEIGLLYVGDLKLENLPEIVLRNIGVEKNIAFGIAYEINKRIFSKFPDYFKNSARLLKEWENKKSTPVMPEDIAWKKVLEIEPWIAEMIQEERKEEETKKEEQKKQLANIIKIPLLQALQKYPKLAEQPVTASPIKLRDFPAPARPSIKNWIADYRENLGAGHHGVVERGNYLFHGENTKRLNSNERQKLAWILKSLEEDAPLEIDTASEIIIFPRQETANNPQPTTYPPATAMRSDGGQSNQSALPSPQREEKPIINPLRQKLNEASNLPAPPVRFDESRRTGGQSTTGNQSIIPPKKSFLQSIFSKKEKQDEIPVSKSTPQEIRKTEVPLAGVAKTAEKNKETSQPSSSPRKIYKDIKFSRPSFNEINPIGDFEDEFENNSRSGAKINGNTVDLKN